MFRRRERPARPVTIEIDGVAATADAGDSVAAALLAASDGPFRTTPVGGAPRTPWCMMGVCFDCLVEIDGAPNRQACMITVRDGMCVRRQDGARELAP